MGPQQRCCGISPERLDLLFQDLASMGPQQRCCGIGDERGESRCGAGASMGPQQRCCGIKRVAEDVRAWVSSFNGGAAALLRNCMLCVICSLLTSASMGPQQRCRGIKGREGEGKGGEGASMGPQQRCCGITR